MYKAKIQAPIFTSVSFFNAITCKYPSKPNHSLLEIFQHTDTVDGVISKMWFENTEYSSDPPKHKINSILNLIRVVAKIRNHFTNDFNGNAR